MGNIQIVRYLAQHSPRERLSARYANVSIANGAMSVLGVFCTPTVGRGVVRV